MKIAILFLICINYSYASEDNSKKGFFLKQIDYRERGSISFSVPGLARIRFRPSYEYRYKVKKKIIYIEENDVKTNTK